MINVRINDQNQWMKKLKELKLSMDDSFALDKLYDEIHEDKYWKRKLKSSSESVVLDIPVMVHENRMRVIMLFVDMFHRYGKTVYFRYRSSGRLLGVLAK